MVLIMKEKIRPLVQARTTRGHKAREGRGFSRGEIKRAGLTLHEAKLEISIDNRRRTVHLENVQTLKEHFRKSVPLNKIKGVGKVAEGELKKADILDAYDLVDADIAILAQKVSHSEKTLKRWQSEARKLLKK